jgi:hypothetical protein
MTNLCTEVQLPGMHRMNVGDDVYNFAAYLVTEAWASLRRQPPVNQPARRRRPGWALRPGADTPVWNELVKHAAPYLRKRGDKVRLARLLRLPRQRLHQLLVARSACADAERTLLLLAWVQAKRNGQEWV